MNNLNFMRSILSISLPEGKKEELERRAEKSGKTVSSYILGLLEWEKELISEDELVKRIADVETKYKEGKTKTLRSLKDLMK